MAATATERPEQRDVAARWTPHLATGGWTPVVDYFLDHYRELGITNLEAIFLVHLIRFKWTTQMPFPGFKRLAKKMGISATAARGHARRLEKKGLLKRMERVGSTNRFDLTGLFQGLERLQLKKGETEKEEELIATGDSVF
jgi:predicted transcriptional regulator